jgi:hypothetical protein
MINLINSTELSRRGFKFSVQSWRDFFLENSLFFCFIFTAEVKKNSFTFGIEAKGKRKKMEIGATVMTPYRLAESPFLAPLAERLSEDPPTVWHAVRLWYYCQKSQANLRMRPFNDPSMGDCWALFSDRLGASWARGNQECLDRELARRRCEYDPYRLPWAPKQRYLQKLQDEGRLPGSHVAAREKMLADAGRKAAVENEKKVEESGNS